MKVKQLVAKLTYTELLMACEKNNWRLLTIGEAVEHNAHTWVQGDLEDVDNVDGYYPLAPTWGPKLGKEYVNSMSLLPCTVMKLDTSSRDTQVGGDHYSKHTIQPFDIINEYKLDFYEGNVLKYLLRHKYKNGTEDIDKAIDYLNRVKEIHYEN